MLQIERFNCFDLEFKSNWQVKIFFVLLKYALAMTILDLIPSCIKRNDATQILEIFQVLQLILLYLNLEGHAVAQLVEALRYKSEGRGFDSRWCHWNFSFT